MNTNETASPDVQRIADAAVAALGVDGARALGALVAGGASGELAPLPDHIKQTESHRDLVCALSTDELETLSDLIAKLYDELVSIEDEKKEVGAEIRARLLSTRRRFVAALDKRRTRTESRRVAVLERRDLNKKTVTIFRTDTGEKIEERKMNSEELQLRIEDARNAETEAMRVEAEGAAGEVATAIMEQALRDDHDDRADDAPLPEEDDGHLQDRDKARDDELTEAMGDPDCTCAPRGMQSRGMVVCPVCGGFAPFEEPCPACFIMSPELAEDGTPHAVDGFQPDDTVAPKKSRKKGGAS